MRYFVDCEFCEGKQAKTLLGFKYGETKPTIDLISIGLVAEDGRELYLISKDFNLKEAWNRWQPREQTSFEKQNNFEGREYWLRNNVLKPIWEELQYKEYRETSNDIKKDYFKILDELPEAERKYFYVKNMLDFGNGVFCYSDFKRLINKYGKTNKQIAEEIEDFVNGIGLDISIGYGDKEFYGYFSDYDWVVFCQLYGTMNELPKGFPMFCFDIQQQIEEYKINKDLLLKEVPQINCHNALQDAHWNFNAYKWIKNKINNGR